MGPSWYMYVNIFYILQSINYGIDEYFVNLGHHFFLYFFLFGVFPYLFYKINLVNVDHDYSLFEYKGKDGNKNL